MRGRGIGWRLDVWKIVGRTVGIWSCELCRRARVVALLPVPLDPNRNISSLLFASVVAHFACPAA